MHGAAQVWRKLGKSGADKAHEVNRRQARHLFQLKVACGMKCCKRCRRAGHQANHSDLRCLLWQLCVCATAFVAFALTLFNDFFHFYSFSIFISYSIICFLLHKFSLNANSIQFAAIQFNFICIFCSTFDSSLFSFFLLYFFSRFCIIFGRFCCTYTHAFNCLCVCVRVLAFHYSLCLGDLAIVLRHKCFKYFFCATFPLPLIVYATPASVRHKFSRCQVARFACGSTECAQPLNSSMENGVNI